MTSAEDAIRKLQTWPMNPHSPVPVPAGAEYEATVAAAAAAGAEALIGRLDGGAVDIPAVVWDTAAFDALPAPQRKEYQTAHDEALAAVATRKAYLVWLVGAVCNTPAGLSRALEIAAKGTTQARLAAAEGLRRSLSSDEGRRACADALDPRSWDGAELMLERVYRVGVRALAELSPGEAFVRYSDLVSRGGVHAQAVLHAIIASTEVDPRWGTAVLPLLPRVELSQLALMVLEKLSPEPSWVEPLCSALPKPEDSKAFWNPAAVKLLAKVANLSALPWLRGALHAAGDTTWPAVFDGFKRARNPAMSLVIREWLGKNDAPDRRKHAEEVLAVLEKNLPRPSAPVAPASVAPVVPAKPPRPTLVFSPAPAFKKPKVDKPTAIAALFKKAKLTKHAKTLPQKAAWLFPKRVDDAKLKKLGGTKLGGHPDLEASTEWPRVDGVALTFLAQVNLADAGKHLPKKALPSAGLLSFFADEGCKHARVLFTTPKTKLQRREVPEDFGGRIFQAATATLHGVLRLPSPNDVTLTGEELERYEKQVFVAQPELPQLLGFSQLLLQLPGDAQTGMEKKLSFFIAADALKRGDFSNVWV